MADEVVMLGDSYMDIGHVGPDIMADAMAKYRHYYLAGSAMNYESGALNIPHQYEVQAMGDTSVAMPKDIKVIIMDGGGNDILINNAKCLSATSLDAMVASCPTSTGGSMACTCRQAVDGSLARGKKLLMEAAANGVKHGVYFFYPHLDPAGGGILPTPAPNVNALLDYALPQLEQLCCGASFTSTTTNYSCRGQSDGLDCVVIDPTPAFTGHTTGSTTASTYWLQGDHVHPNDMGGQTLAGLVWKAMQDNCIAQ